VGGRKRRTRAPTVRPAATEGTEPVRMKPVRPPPAVRAARMKAGVSLPCEVAGLLASGGVVVRR